MRRLKQTGRNTRLPGNPSQIINMKLKLILLWVLRLLAAAIMLQTLYFKFTAHPQSVQLFTEIGLEPQGRIITGIFELIASVLILIPRYSVYGAVLGCMMMTGAIY